MVVHFAFIWDVAESGHTVSFGFDEAVSRAAPLTITRTDNAVSIGHRWRRRRNIKRTSSREELFELHDIAGQRTSFIREDVLDLPQLFVDIRRLSFHVEVLLIVVHFKVPAHKRPLPKLDNLQRQDQRYWNEVAKEKQIT